MATIASPSETKLYLNAFDKSIQYEGVMKTIDDDYWTKEIVPILYPMWDSDKDKLELFVQYKDTTAKMNKTKYSRNQKTGEFKSLEELRKLFEQYENVENKIDLVFTCGSGVTAAVLAYAYKMVNNDYTPKIYDGSWSEYGKYPA